LLLFLLLPAEKSINDDPNMTEAEKEIARAAAKDGACYIYFKIFKKNAEMEHCFFFFFFFRFWPSFRGFIYAKLPNIVVSFFLTFDFFSNAACVLKSLCLAFFPPPKPAQTGLNLASFAMKYTETGQVAKKMFDLEAEKAAKAAKTRRKWRPFFVFVICNRALGVLVGWLLFFSVNRADANSAFYRIIELGELSKTKAPWTQCNSIGGTLAREYVHTLASWWLFFIFLLKDGAEQEMAHAPGDSEAPVEVREAAGVQQRPPGKRPAAAIPQSVQYI
jgi:hypothetical protein